MCRCVAPPLVSSPVALSPLATEPFNYFTATGRHRCDVPWPRRHRLWQRRVRPFGCVAIACGGAVHYRVRDVTAVTSPGCVATACGLAVCCRRWASPLVSPRDATACGVVGCAVAACDSAVHHHWASPLVSPRDATACGVVGCVVAACDGAVHYRCGTSPPRRLCASSPPLVAASCAVVRLRRHLLWRCRLLPRWGVIAVASPASPPLVVTTFQARDGVRAPFGA